MARHQADAIVIGGGIHGASTALHLARHGLDVALLEADQIGRHASGANAGSIHHIPRVHFELPLAEAALAIWPNMAELLDDDCGFAQVGYLRLVEGEQEVAGAHQAMDRVRRHSDIVEHWLDAEALHDLQPGLRRTVVGGIWAPSCGHANPARTMDALRRRLDALGVAIHEDAPVGRIAREGSGWVCRAGDEGWYAPVVVNCAGAWGAEVAGLIDEPVPLVPAALMMTVTARETPCLKTVVGLVGRRLSMKQLPNGTVLIGGGYRGDIAPGGRSARPDPSRLAYNLALAQHVLPALSSATVMRSWTGIEGFAPDHAAYIGPSLRHQGIWHAFGFSAHGFYIGPVVGDLLAEAIVTGVVPDLLRPFALDRPAVTTAPTRATELARPARMAPAA